MQENRIISALIGLIGACNNNPKTENTDRVIIKALAFPLIHPEANDGAFQEIVEEIHAEKFTVAPGCAQCATPCGNTSDYDMSRIYHAEDEIRQVKLQILAILQESAADITLHGKLHALPTECLDFFYKALSYVSYDMEKDGLAALLGEAQENKQNIKRYLQI